MSHLKRVIDIYNYCVDNELKMLSNYSADFWEVYRNNHQYFDRLFCRSYRSFVPFGLTDSPNIEELSADWIIDIASFLTANDKRYSELWRLQTVSDTDYSILDNYNVRETHGLTGSKEATEVFGARADSKSGSTQFGQATVSDSNSFVHGARSESDSGSISYGLAEKTDSNSYTHGAQSHTDSESTVYGVGEHTESNSYIKGAKRETDEEEKVYGAQHNVTNVELNVGDQTNTKEDKVSADNESAYYSKDYTTGTTGTREDITDTIEDVGTHTDSRENVHTEATYTDTESKTVTDAAHTDTKSGTHGEASYIDSESKTHQDKAHTDNTTDSHTEASYTDTESKSRTLGQHTDSTSETSNIGAHTDNKNYSETESRTVSKVGNIGIFSASKLLSEHNDLWTAFNFYKLIFDEIANEFLRIIYF